MTKATLKKQMASAIARNQRRLKSARDDGEDDDIIKLYREDVLDLKKIAGFVQRDDRDSAEQLCEHMDTAIRDEIPEAVFNWIHPDE